MPIIAGLGQSPVVRTADRLIARSRRLSALRERLEGAWAWAAEGPRRRRRLLAWGGAGAGVLAVGLGAGLYLAIRPMPKPDYEDDSIYKVFKYTLLTDEFNKLPIEERLRLLGVIRRRVETLGRSESVLLAAFASGIVGETREQLEENVARLMIDSWDVHAVEYASVAPEDRAEFVDRAFVQMHEMMDLLEDGTLEPMTPGQRLAEGREQAQRDLRRIREGRGPSARALSRIHRILDHDIGSHASPQQEIRGQLLMRDMTRRLRGQPIPGAG